MCGRARCTLSPAQVARAFGFPTTSANAGGGGDGPAVPMLHLDRFRPSYNVLPGAYLPVGAVRARPGCGDGRWGADGEGPVIQCMKWGLVPSFTSKTEKPNHFRMFNARSESVKEKVSFRRLIQKNRCLAAVEGFYEWKKNGSKKQPYYIHFQDHRPLVFAALYDTWTNSEGEINHTFTILTTRASTSLNWLHGKWVDTLSITSTLNVTAQNRMPVILGSKDSVNAWLNDASVKLEEITAPYEGADLVWYPVTSSIGKTSFDGPECIKEVHIGPTDKPISKFFAKKLTAYGQSGQHEKMSWELAGTLYKAAKAECDESVQDQPEEVNQQQSREKQTTNSIVKDEPVTLEPQVLEKLWSIKHEDSMTLTDATMKKQGDSKLKRKIKDIVEAEIKPSQPTKKEKVVKAGSDGQVSLLSYFARKQVPGSHDK